MKVVFLDVDGVLNSELWNESHKSEIRTGSLVDKRKVQLLREIIVKTDANIVLHSGWRFWFDHSIKPLRIESQNLVDLLSENGLSIYDVTPDLTTEEIRKTKKFSLVKAKEILMWLEQIPNTTTWIVIDDLDLDSKELDENQIKTNPEIGLTEEDVKNAIRMLNRKIKK